MSYANVDMIRPYLVSLVPSTDRIYDQVLTFYQDDPILFFPGEVEAEGFRVKAIRAAGLKRVSLTLSTTTAISSSPLVAGSVVVASDSSLGKVYVENLDYAIDYEGGTLTLKDGGTLTEESGVVVWYQEHYLYRAGSDYSLDARRGYIRRLTGGDIAPNERVRLDYGPNWSAYSENVLAAAVAEANGMVASEVDPDRQFGAEPALQAAAVYRALEIVALSAATRQLSGQPDSDRAAIAWIKLAEQFAERARQYLNDFRPDRSGPVSPTHS